MDRSQLPGHGVRGREDFGDVSLPPSQPEGVKAFERMQAELCVFGSGVFSWGFFFFFLDAGVRDFHLLALFSRHR